MNARMKFVIGAVIIIVTLGWLGWVGATESKTYYHTLSELAALQGPARRQRMRVSGYVKEGSIQRLGNQVDFVLTEQGRALPVSYIGSDPLPDTFYEKNAQALVQGRLDSSGKQFVATQVEAKCASKYVAAPGAARASAPPTAGTALETAH